MFGGCSEGVGMSLSDELFECVKSGDLAGTYRLLRLGADVHARSDYALRWACLNGHIRIVEILLAFGANIHAINDQSLCYACANGHVDVVELLLQSGADVHSMNDFLTLELTYIHDHINVIIKLVEAGLSLEVLRSRWVDLFGCEAPIDLANISSSDIKELLGAEAVRRELT